MSLGRHSWRFIVLAVLVLACRVGPSLSDEVASGAASNSIAPSAAELYQIGWRLGEEGNKPDCLRALLTGARLAREEGSSRLSFDTLRAVAQACHRRTPRYATQRAFK